MRGLKDFREKSPNPIAFDNVSMSSHYSKTSKTTGGEFQFGTKKIPVKRNVAKNLYTLGIVDKQGQPNPQMIIACKVLLIDLEELEPKTFDDFLNKIHSELYDKGGEDAVRNVNVSALAKLEQQIYEKKRQHKI